MVEILDAVIRALVAALHDAKRHGVRASRLHRYGRPLVDLIVSDATGSVLDAEATERAISTAAGQLNDRIGATILHLVGLHPTSEGLSLALRREYACRAFGRDANRPGDRYTRKHFIDAFEDDLIYDLAVQIQLTLTPTGGD